MEWIYTLVKLMMAIILANFLAQAVPKIPKAFWQIGFGVLMAAVPVFSSHNIRLDPEWFMMVVIAPLLYFEGQKANARLISKNFRSILSLAGLIAILTILVLTIFGHTALGWTVPGALGIAAIVTPTDATALESVTEGRQVPKGIARALNLESLFNDATGLVVLELSLLWLNTGYFSFWDGFKEFMVVAFGGALFGLVSGIVVTFMRQHLLKGQFDDVASHVLINVMLPIMVYAFAEHVGVSGIIAVVILGVVANEEKHHTQFMSTQLNNLNNQVTNILTQILNGVVFVLLGMSLVRVVREYLTQPLGTWIGIIGTGVAIYAVMTLFRYLMIVRESDGPLAAMLDNRKLDAKIFAFGGVHGAVTMAMAFSLPLTLSSGMPFPQRDALLLIAATVIIVSLVVPLLVLPRLLPAIEPAYDMDAYSKAHISMINYGMAYIENQPLSNAIKEHVISQLQDQLGYGQDQLDRDVWQRANSDIQRVTNEALKDAIEANTVSEPTMIYYRRVMASQDGQWARGAQNAKLWFKILERMAMRWFNTAMRSKKQRQRRMERLMARSQKRIDRRMANIDKLSDHDRRELERSVARQKRYMMNAKKMAASGGMDKAFDIYQSQRNTVFAEIAEVAAEPIAEFIEQADKTSDDPRYVVALRDVAAQNRARARDERGTSSEEQEALLAALQAELTFVQAGRANDEFSPALLKTLYDEVTSAQALVLAADNEE